MPTPTTVELLWGTQQRPKRGPKPALSLERIVEEAIALVDAEGLPGLSMQKLADRLGFTKMSLYRYVPGKEQLTALMVDVALGSPPDLAAAQADSSEQRWRVELRRWSEAIFARYRAHPWAIELTLGARPIGPNEMGWTEAALVTLAGLGLTGPERLDTIVLLNGHVRSLAQQVRTADDAADNAAASEQFVAQMAETMAAVGDRYPEVLAAVTEEVANTDKSPDAVDPGGALTFGIDRILDGLAVYVANRR